MTSNEEILLQAMRHIASISTGQVKRVAEVALSTVSALNAPPVTKPEPLPDSPPCNPHPDAPHGFGRNASHNAGRYVCDCEGWVPDSKTDWSAA